MKGRTSHRFIGFEVAAVLTLFALTVLWLPAPHSMAQQDNRQLSRDSGRPAGERRIALVIGNGAYQNSKLNNPANDATTVTVALRELGFEVTSGANKTQREMKQMIRDFGQRLRAQGGVGLFYFAGHGVQAKGRNYLIPIDADIQAEADLEDQAVDVNYLLNLLDDAQNALNIVILDACRNNPFARSFRSTQGGLAQLKAPSGTLIAYATAPDNTAADGGGSNSPYTEELTKQLLVPGVLVETMFRRVAEQVSARTSGKQEPWFSANVKGDFYMHASSGTDAASTITDRIAGPTSISEAAKEQALWEAVKDSNDSQDFKDYLAKYPSGAYVEAAQVKLRRLDAARTSGAGISLLKTDSSPGPSGPTVTGKVAVINSEAFYHSPNGVQRVINTMCILALEFAPRTNELRDLKERLDRLKGDLQKATDRTEKGRINDQVEQLTIDIDRKEQDSQRAYKQRKSEIMGYLLQEIDKTTGSIAARHGLTTVADSSKDVISPNATQTDITAEVISEYNRLNPVRDWRCPSQ